MAVLDLLKLKLADNRSIIGQFWRYIVTGGLAFVVDFGVFSLVLCCFDIHYLVANIIALMAGNVVNYLLSLGWVFSAEKRKMEKYRFFEIIVFIIISLIGMGLNEFLMYIFVGVLVIQKLISKVISAIIVLLYNFLARKYVLFKKRM